MVTNEYCVTTLTIEPKRREQGNVTSGILKKALTTYGTNKQLLHFGDMLID